MSFQEDLWVRKSCDKELFALCVKRNCKKPAAADGNK